MELGATSVPGEASESALCDWRCEGAVRASMAKAFEEHKQLGVNKKSKVH